MANAGSADNHLIETMDPARIEGSDITFNRYLINQRGDYLLSDWNRLIVLHEILHAVGLSHPGPYNGPGYNYEDHALYLQDTIQYTVMSYWARTTAGPTTRRAADLRSATRA